MRTPAELAGDDRIGIAFLRQTVDRAVVAILAAGWRPPATTQVQLAAFWPGMVVTGRPPVGAERGGSVVRAAADRVCPDELVEWAPLTRHLHGGDRRPVTGDRRGSRRPGTVGVSC